jgi:hypothetical protein
MRTRSIGSSSSSSWNNYLKDIPYPAAVVLQVSAVLGL